MSQSGTNDSIVKLPEPSIEGTVSLEECLKSRASVREYDDRALTLQEISQILWAAQGITRNWGGRTAPSAGALYPIRLYLAVENVDGLDVGSWEYDPHEHSLKMVKEGELLWELKNAALGQECVGNAPVVLLIAAFPEITRAKYHDRTMRYVDTEVGCICQSVYLQCETLGLGTVAVGAFTDEMVSEIISTEADPRLLMPIGSRKQ